jgi:hypothetical protein
MKEQSWCSIIVHSYRHSTGLTGACRATTCQSEAKLGEGGLLPPSCGGESLALMRRGEARRLALEMPGW